MTSAIAENDTTEQSMNVHVACGREETMNSTEQTMTHNSKTDTSELLSENVNSNSCRLHIAEASAVLARFVQMPEDDGNRLKTTACMNAWYDLEATIRTVCAYIREGVVRQQPALKQMIKDAKTMLEESSLRVRVYDAAMACHRAMYLTSTARTDMEKYEARRDMLAGIDALDAALDVVPGRFKAARRDLLQTNVLLKELEITWKDDILQRMSHRPHWVPNDFSRKCSKCQRAFSLMRTRHHCRACGLIFCDACTTMLDSLPKIVYYTAQRVCVDCKTRHMNHVAKGQQHLQHLLTNVFPELADF